jgi:SARP family transcriptional regulator, regulator of embCAB operon
MVDSVVDRDTPDGHVGNSPLAVKILGTLLVGNEYWHLSPSAPKQRAVLAMLSANVNTTVPARALIEELWGSSVPSSARTTLQGYIVGLRKLIASVHPAGDARRRSKQIIATVPTGYQLNNAGGDVDVRRFEELTGLGHRARQQKDMPGAVRSFASALDCWRGSPLMDVRQGPHLRVLAAGLEEARLNALDCRIEAELHLGRHHELLGELAGLVSRHTTHEGLHAHYMLALYRSGRRCEALAVYRQLQESLAVGHGLDPTPPLRRLQRSMLSSGLDASGPAPESTSLTGEESRTPILVGRQPGGDRSAGPRRRGISAELAAVPWDVPDASTEPPPSLGRSGAGSASG